jgi:hypothetical protein
LAAGAITFFAAHRPKTHTKFNYPFLFQHLILLKFIALPFYRITIWLKNQRKPLQGIRFVNQSNIDLVQNLMEAKARMNSPINHVIDVEVAMLSKNSTVIKKHQKLILRRSGNMD